MLIILEIGARRDAPKRVSDHQGQWGAGALRAGCGRRS